MKCKYLSVKGKVSCVIKYMVCIGKVKRRYKLIGYDILNIESL